LLAAVGFINTTRLRFENPPFTNIDASFGVEKDAWNVLVFGENLANKNTSLFTNVDQFIVAETPMRPRVIGVKIGYSF
jgi:iron complex outermembrane receptor protein